ncbi:MAG: hypothetical protein OEY38_23640 [Gammaproteobacteria bacterium]|nr:hypothetical protein [Gammaproteobacteria bacterium]
MIHFLPGFYIGMVLLFLSACSGSEQVSTQQQSVSRSIVSGQAVKGIMQHASVDVFTLNSNSNQFNIEAIASSHTDHQGFYHIELPANVSGPLLLKLSVNEHTHMRCDTQVGCKNKVKGESFIPGSEFYLQTVLPFVTSQKTNVANINIFTDLAAALLISRTEQQGKRLDSLSSAQSLAEISDLLRDYALLQTQDNVLTVAIADITDSDELHEFNNQQQLSSFNLGFASAAVARWASEQFNGDFVAALAHIRETYVANQGEFALAANNAQLFDMSRLLMNSKAEVKALDVDTLAMASAQQLMNTIALQQNRIADLLQHGETHTDSNYSQWLALLNNPSELAKALVKNFRAITYSMDDIVNQTTGVGIEVLKAGMQTRINNDTHSVVQTAKSLFPYSADIIQAMIWWSIKGNDGDEYDLAEDRFALLSDHLNMSGVVVLKLIGDAKQLRLNNAVVDGLGTMNLTLLISPRLFSSNQAMIDMDLSLLGENMEFHLHNQRLHTQWSVLGQWKQLSVYPYYQFVPTDYEYPMSLGGSGEMRVVLKQLAGTETVVLNANNEWALAWPNKSLRRLPTLNRLVLSKSSYSLNEHVYIRDMSLSYVNLNTKVPTTNLEWAKLHGEQFSLTSSNDVLISLPNLQGQNIERNVSWSFNVLQRTSAINPDKTFNLKLDYDGEAFEMSKSTDKGNVFQFANQLGTLMALVLSDDGQSVTSGNIWQDHQLVATIEASRMGPLIRFLNGDIESF